MGESPLEATFSERGVTGSHDPGASQNAHG